MSPATPKPRVRILVVDDDPDIRELLSDRLQLMGFEPLCAKDGAEALGILRQDAPALTVLDLQLPGLGGMEVLQTIRREGLETTVIVITAWATAERAVEAMRSGAYDFISKPLDPAHLEVVINKALERERLREENRLLHSELDTQDRSLIGESPGLQALRRTAQQAAASNATILLRGESGTGKEILARAIHRWSPRNDRPLVIVNCVALSEELLESELFGHEKGAFTGAHQRKQGKVELAHGGTLFLDEIGDLRPSLQAKLLRLLQEQEFERVGGAETIRVDVRIIAATHRNLQQLMREGKFREDLYYRLNVIPIHLPPLRERKSDIALLVEFLLERFTAKGKGTATSLSPRSMSILMDHGWPGNVRELENVLEHAMVCSRGAVIEPEALPRSLLMRQPETSPNGSALSAPVESHSPSLEAERQVVLRALEGNGWNRGRAAESLGVDRTTLWRKMRRLGIS